MQGKEICDSLEEVEMKRDAVEEDEIRCHNMI
jgi:hypothetical protein